MSIQKQGYSGTVQEVDAVTRAACVTTRPMNVVANGGTFSASAVSGKVGAGASSDSHAFVFRNSSATVNCLVRRVIVSLASDDTGFTAGRTNVDMLVSRAITVPTADGTSLTLTTNNSKRRTTMQTIAGAVIRIATTAALTGATATNDATPLRTLSVGTGTATFTSILTNQTLYESRPDEYPLLLVSAEQFAIRVTVPATGTWKIAVSVDWDEVPIASF